MVISKKLKLIRPGTLTVNDITLKKLDQVLRIFHIALWFRALIEATIERIEKR